MKQTAVEWFLTEFQKQVWFEPESELDIWIKNLIPKAKEKEKEQIIEAHRMSSIESGFEHSAEDWANTYYNETYKNK